MDLVLFYMPDDDYETAYAYFKIDDNMWEFAPGGAWIWADGECEDDGYDVTTDPCYMGEWDASRDDFEYDFDMEEWDDEYFWECGSHGECYDIYWEDMACATYWRGDGWEWGNACVEWW